VTLGPKGRNVVLERSFGAPTVTKDGVSVAKEIELKDKFENMGAQMVKEVASKTSDVAGDGTTTATVLAQSIVREGMKFVASGMNPMDLKRGIDQGCHRGRRGAEEALQALHHEQGNRPGRGYFRNADEAIGKIISDAMDKSQGRGDHGRGRKGLQNELEVVEGMQFDRRVSFAVFINNAEKQISVLEEPYILLHDKKISNIRELLPILEQVAKSGKPLLIVAEEVEGEALADARSEQPARNSQDCAVKAPDSGIGARQCSKTSHPYRRPGHCRGSRTDPRKAGLKDLGRAKRIEVAKEETTVIDGAGDPKAIEARVKNIRTQIDEATSDYDKEKLQERVAKLAGGVAVIKVGAATEVEMKEKKARRRRRFARYARGGRGRHCRGGGVAYIRARAALDKLKGENPRPGSRHQDHPASLGRAVTHDRRQRRRRTFGGHEQDHGRKRQLRLQRPDRRVRRYGRNGRARSDQGEPHRAAKRGFGCRAAPHHRGDGGRACRREEECRGPRSRRNGRMGGMEGMDM